MPGKLIVTKVSHGTRRKLYWRDEQGRTGEAPVGAIGPAERMRLFTETGHGLEPLWLWLTEGGTPMSYQSWEKVFDTASTRVAAVFAAATRRDGRRRTAIACSPHMMRHSFALYMLVALHHALDRRSGDVVHVTSFVHYDLNSAGRFSATRVGSYGLSGVPGRTVTHGALTPARRRPMVIATAFHHATY